MEVQNNLRARVFISCGQNEEDERNIAHKIYLKLKSMGYDPYIAVEEQTLKGFTQNILPRLDESEYYIFIDFRREQLLQNSKPIGCRGSLFSHQELAIATFLDKPVIAFQEQYLKPRDGIIGFLQINPKEFTDRETLPYEVEKVVKDRNWNTRSRHELILERKESEYEGVMYGEQRIPSRFYHIDVTNLHHLKTARNCVIYRQSIKLPSGQRKVPEPVEMKWKGVNVQQVLIPPKFTREFDGVVVFEKESNQIYFGINTFLTDYSGYPDEYKITNPGIYELEFVVFSDNFRASREWFILNIGNNMNILQFYKKPTIRTNTEN